MSVAIFLIISYVLLLNNHLLEVNCKNESIENVNSILLSDGNKIPILGFGTFKLGSDNKQGSTSDRKSDDKLVEERVKAAIDAGFRHIDTALLYMNEKGVGRAVRSALQSGQIKSRDDIFITSKVWQTFHSRPKVLEGIQLSLQNLGLEYLDLALIHWPLGWKENDGYFPKHPNGSFIASDVDYIETWKGMEDIKRMGLAKSIGVSNFNHKQLQRLIDSAHIKPVINQVENHPYLSQEKLIEFCKNNSIAVTAYAPLGHGNMDILFVDPTLREIAKKHKKTNAQIAIRWQIQRGVIAIPKTARKEKAIENFDVFDFTLSDNEMQQIDGINKNLKIFTYDESKHHRYYPFYEEY